MAVIKLDVTQRRPFADGRAFGEVGPYRLVEGMAHFAVDPLHPRNTIIWAHCGLGRIVRPVKDQLSLLERALNNPELSHIYIDISWDEVAKYVVATPESIQAVADVINRHPDRFLFGSDEVAPTEQSKYLKVYDMYAPLFAKLTPDASQRLRMGNYERLFDEARRRVRAWEAANVH